ncbi:MAG: polyprenyl synthetase family protein [Kiritimatiellaceae bacterium]|nr:polyprenyl synthetase family protein [Kiritimatiellaceae bacterium]
MNDSTRYLLDQAQAVNDALDQRLPVAETHPTSIHEAMRYSMFAGGKRLRPILCIAACEACGGTTGQALDAACALELFHTSTLIHDDLPAMDNDTLRRGRPTCHIQFDEATAILAGDALLILAFEALAQNSQAGALTLELTRAAGSQGVIGGQIEDLAAEGKPADADRLDYIHRHKTAALIRAACVMGGLCADADCQTLEKLAEYGESLGLAFQLIDDLLDETATQEELGKDIGSDRKKGKMTWPAVHGLDVTRARAAELTKAACDAAETLPNSDTLKMLAKEMAVRRF